MSPSVNEKHSSVTQMNTNLNMEHDSIYFRTLLNSEATRLNSLCSKWEKISESETELAEEGKQMSWLNICVS